MERFTVWAPGARTMDVEVDGTRQAMKRVRDSERPGWWAADVAGANPVSRYGFSINGGPVFPDPRTPYQPEGPHKPSQLVDHSAYNWKADGWKGDKVSAASVLYETHIGTFTQAGTWPAAERKLDHLKQLGVTHVSVMPGAQFGDYGWGYDGVQLFAPQNTYGKPSDVKHFTDMAHRKGLNVIMDVVYNHLGADGNYLGAYGPYFTNKHQTPWGSAVNLDQPGSRETRQLLLDNALMWVRDYRFDGLRLDATHEYHDNSKRHFMRELSDTMAEFQERSGRRVTLIAESDRNDPRTVTPVGKGGFGMDAQWTDDLHHSIFALQSGANRAWFGDFQRGLPDIAKALTKGFVYDGEFSVFRGKNVGAPVGDLSGDHFVMHIDNHDHTGNSPAGRRRIEMLGRDKVQTAMATLFMAPGVPMLFMGDPEGTKVPFPYFAGHKDSEINRMTKEGRIREFSKLGWDVKEIADPISRATFNSAKMDAKVDPVMVDWTKTLTALRASQPALTDGSFKDTHVSIDAAKDVMVVQRGPVTLVSNWGKTNQQVAVPEGRLIAPLPLDKARRGHYRLPANSVIISIKGDTKGLPPMIDTTKAAPSATLLQKVDATPAGKQAEPPQDQAPAGPNNSKLALEKHKVAGRPAAGAAMTG